MAEQIEYSMLEMLVARNVSDFFSDVGIFAYA
jgi:hypothetical protein